jgi:predicted PurR-regulated permease PerM
VKQIVEPKIVGEQVGLYALTTVIALYLGLKLMGGVGLIVAPLYVIVCKKLNAEGVISLYKTKDFHDDKEEKDIIEKKD